LHKGVLAHFDIEKAVKDAVTTKKAPTDEPNGCFCL